MTWHPVPLRLNAYAYSTRVHLVTLDISDFYFHYFFLTSSFILLLFTFSFFFISSSTALTSNTRAGGVGIGVLLLLFVENNHHCHPTSTVYHDSILCRGSLHSKWTSFLKVIPMERHVPGVKKNFSTYKAID